MQSKHRVGLFALALSLLLVQPERSRADVAAGRQDYIVMGRETQMRSLYDENNDGLLDGDAAYNTMNSIVSLTASADNQVVIYDHWEDGLEADPLNPTQTASTMKFTLFRGQTISFVADNTTAGACTAAGVGGATGQCAFTGTLSTAAPNIATNSCTYTCARVPSTPATRGTSVRFDGGDRITSLGGALTVVHQVDPNDPLYAVATEHFSLQSISGFLNYRVPIGQGGTGDTFAFKYARAFVTAFSDNTHVSIDNGTRNITVTLNAGQTYSTSSALGTAGQGTAASIDETVLAAAQNITLTTGTRIDTDKEVTVSIMNGSGTAHTDLEAVLPVRAYGRDFVLPVSRAQTVQGGGTTEHYIFLFNPNDVIANLTIYDVTNPNGAATTIDPNSQKIYKMPATAYGATPHPPAASRIRSDQPIWGLGILDALDQFRDASYALVPTRFLQNEYFVPYTSTSQGGSGSGSALFIAPTQDNTRVCIYAPGATSPKYWDIDGSGSLVDNNGATDGNATDDCPNTRYGCCNAITATAPVCTSVDPCYTLHTDANRYTNRNSALKIFGGTISNLQGVRIVATAPVVVEFIPDPEVAATAGGLDLGFSIVPPSSFLIEELLTASMSASPGSIPATGTTTLTMTGVAGSQGPITNLNFALTLSNTFFSSAPSVTVTPPTGAPYLVVGVAEAANPTPPSGFTRYRFTLDPTTQLQADEAVSLALTLTGSASVPASNLLSLTVNGTLGATGYKLAPTASLILNKTPLQLTMTAPSIVAPLQTFTYDVTISNGGSADISGPGFSDPLPEGLTYVGNVAWVGTLPADPTLPNCSVNVATATLGCAFGSNVLTSTAPLHFSFQVQAQALPGSTTVNNIARATSTGITDALSSPVKTTITPPSWVVTSIPASNGTITANGTFLYEVCTHDAPAVDATNVVVDVELPTQSPGLTYVAASFDYGDGTTWTAATPSSTTDLSHTFATLTGGQDACIRFKVKLAAGVTNGTQFSLRGNVLSDQTPLPQSGSIFTLTASTTDVTAPTVLATTSGTTVGPFPTFTGSITDDIALAASGGSTVQICNAACASCAAAVAVTLAGDGSFSYTPGAALSPGAQCAKFTGKDTSNNTASANVVYTVSDSIPTASVTPAATPSNDSTPSFSGNVTDDTAGVGATISYCQSDCTTACSAPATLTLGGGGAYTATAPLLADGSYCAKVIATDSSTQTATATALFVVDLTAPTASVTTPLDTTTDTTPSFTVTITDERPGATGTIKFCSGDCSTGCTATSALSSGVTILDAPALSSGPHCAVVVAIDAAGNPTSPSPSTKTFTVDTSAPTASVTPDGTPSNDTTPGFTGTVTDDAAGVSAVIKFCPTDCSSCGPLVGTSLTLNGAGAYSVSAPTLTEGTYCAQVTATDASSKQTIATATFVVDLTAPTLTAAGPGATNDDTPHFSGTLSDTNGIGGVTVSYCDSDCASNCGAPSSVVLTGGAFSFDGPSYAEGSYCAVFVGTDASSNSTSRSVPFTIDTSAPSVTIVPPAQNPTNDTTPTFTGTVTDNGSISTVTIVYCDSDCVSNCSSPIAVSGSPYTTTAPTLTDGDYCAVITATDTASNSASQSALFTIDSAAASVSLDALPAAGQNRTPTLTGHATAPSSISQVAITLYPSNGAAGCTTTPVAGYPTNATLTAPSFSFTPSTALADGKYCVKATATSGNGLTAEQTSQYLIVDNVAPSTTVTATPSSGSDVAQHVTISGTVDNGAGLTPASVTVVVDNNGVIQTFTPAVAADGTWSVTGVDLGSSGSVSITATPSDAAGNTGTPASTSTLTIDATPPAAPTIDHPTEGGVLPPEENGGVTVDGHGDPGSHIDVVCTTTSGTLSATATVNADGTWSTSVAGPFADGPVTCTATATDDVGNASTPDTVTFTVDDTPPAAPVITSPGPGSTVPSDGFDVTGTCEPGSTVTINVGGQVVTTTCDGGTFTGHIPGPINAGGATITATATDPAGNVSTSSSVGVQVSNGIGDGGDGTTGGDDNPPAVNAYGSARVIGGVGRCSGAGSPDASWFFVAALLIARRRFKTRV